MDRESEILCRTNVLCPMSAVVAYLTVYLEEMSCLLSPSFLHREDSTKPHLPSPTILTACLKTSLELDWKIVSAGGDQPVCSRRRQGKYLSLLHQFYADTYFLNCNRARLWTATLLTTSICPTETHWRWPTSWR